MPQHNGLNPSSPAGVVWCQQGSLTEDTFFVISPCPFLGDCSLGTKWTVDLGLLGQLTWQNEETQGTKVQKNEFVLKNLC